MRFAGIAVLVAPDILKHFVVRADASDASLEAVLLQENGGILHPVAYASRKLNTSNKNYLATKRECLTLVMG